jgi:hypothetical protein
MTNQSDALAIRALIENWGIYRDARDWPRFRALWHPDGMMMATWFQGNAEQFIKVSQQGYDNGARIWHAFAGHSIDVNGKRAIGQSKMTITQRGMVENVLCDVVCTGRFYTFLEKRKGKWGLVLLQPIYERDRIDPVDPSAKLKLAPKLLASFPVGYRHLAYLQTRAGFTVKKDMPGLDGPELSALYRKGERWLAGKKLG